MKALWKIECSTSKLNIHVPLNLAGLLLGMQMMPCSNITGEMHKSIHSGTVYSSKNLEKIQMHMKGSLVVQWLRLQALSAGGQGLILGLETRSHMLQLRPGAAKF